MKKYHPDGRYQKNSTRNIHKKWLEKHRVNLVDNDSPWTNSDLDILLEGYLVHRWHYTHEDPNIPTFLGALRRSWDSIYTKLRKLFARDGLTKFYTRGPSRTDRSLIPFDERDMRGFRISNGEWGQKNGANTFEWIANWSGRSVKSLRKQFKEIQRKKQNKMGLLKMISKTNDQELINSVIEYLNKK